MERATPHGDNLPIAVHQAFRFELYPSTTTPAAPCSHSGASRFAHNFAVGPVKDRPKARKTLEVVALRQGALADEARAWAAGTARPVPWTLYALRREAA
ncbi:MAG: hypothetical protein ACLQRM_11345 [Acidimicrobiales bacterium]